MEAKKRGRKAGSGSFVSVSLEDLNKALKPSARVVVWGRYAQMLELDSRPVEAKHDTLVASVNSGAAEVVMDTFGEKTPEVNKTTEVKEDLVQKPDVTLDIF